MPSGPEWIWIIIAVVVLFGASRLPLLGRNIGQGIKEFRKGIKEVGRDEDGKQVEADRKDGAEPKAVEGSTPEKLAERRD